METLIVSSGDVVCGLHLRSRQFSFSLKLGLRSTRLIPVSFEGPNYQGRAAPFDSMKYSANYYFSMSVKFIHDA